MAIVEGPNNRDLSNRFIEEVINGRKLSLIDETVAEDFVYIDSTIGTVKGRDSLKERLTRMFSSFPDLVWTVEQYLSEGDTIVTTGQIKLRNGSPITVDNSVQPSNDANPQLIDK